MASLSIQVEDSSSRRSKTVSMENPANEGGVVKPAHKRSSALKAAAVAVLLVVGVIVAVVALVGPSAGAGSSASGNSTRGAVRSAGGVSGSVTCSSKSLAEQAVKVLSEYASKSDTCATRQAALEANVADVSKNLNQVSKLSNRTSLVLELVVNKTASLDSRLEKMAGLARKVPKYGKYIQLALKFFKDVLGLLRKVQPRVKYVNKLVLIAAKGFKHMATALKVEVEAVKKTAVVLLKGSELGGQAVRCAAATTAPLCQDDDAVLSASTGFNKLMGSGYSGIDACVTTIGKYDKFVGDIKAFLNAQVELVLLAVATVLERIETMLKPVIDFINYVIDVITKTLNEAYCCKQPYALQKAGEVAGKVADLVTCPVDGALEGVRNEINNFVDEVMQRLDSMIAQWLQPLLPVLQEMAKVKFDYPELSGEFALNSAKCALTTPALVTRTFAPFEEAIESLTLTREPLQRLPGIGDAILAACNTALNDLKDVDTSSCCSDWMPLKPNGFACDPTTLGWAQESCFAMCASGTFQSWPDHIVKCGVSPRWPDGTLCGLGTTCGQCLRPATYWFTKALTACGPEPKTWADGTACGVGTTCNACIRPATYWYRYAFTMCGKEPGWQDGTLCALGSTCNACANVATYWAGKAFTACGKEPCWGKNTLCAFGTSCSYCCKAATWYWTGFGYYCN
jgi:hypothetical protein